MGYVRLAFEDLNIAGLTQSRVARAIHDVGWRRLVPFTQYKAARAGVEVVLVDPRGASQTCPTCAAVAAKLLSLYAMSVPAVQTWTAMWLQHGSSSCAHSGRDTALGT
ncbi:transposase [uncultured Methylobacterium sp.]|uniref:transposase n=1 Tax=uncultured Methylobacterium sp. TaxID=157278 RepID=UPI002593A824|nr:transposase [uncultured Methylobacterium sp.]